MTIDFFSSPRARGGCDTPAFFLGAARILRARGVFLTSRRVSSLARLAKSFTERQAMGRIEALAGAARYLVPRWTREDARRKPRQLVLPRLSGWSTPGWLPSSRERHRASDAVRLTEAASVLRRA